MQLHSAGICRVNDGAYVYMSTLRIGSRILILIVLSIGLWLSVRSSNTQDGTASLPVTIRRQDGQATLVDLRCENAELSAPNYIKKLSCVLKNNSNRTLIAGTVSIWVSVEHRGNTELVSTYDSFDTFLHADFHKDHQMNAIPPGGEYRLEQLSTDYGEGVVKQVSEAIDYIEFAEGPPIGPDSRGSQLVSDLRKGAVKYKTWLVQEYRRNQMSADSVVELLNNGAALPPDTELQNANAQKQGANMLRKYFLRVYASEGARGLMKRINY
jgi:hypothetical protein